MSKSTVPRGSTKRVICVCGRYFYRYFENQKLREKCTVCQIPKDGKENK